MPTVYTKAENKHMENLLDFILLQFLNRQPMHENQIITHIHKNIGIYFGPSTIYPFLGTLEKKRTIISTWNMTSERPRKFYQLTDKGKNILNSTETALNGACKKLDFPTQVNP